MSTVGEQFPVELERCRELLDLYNSLPANAGFFGASVIKAVIQRAEAALASGDVVAMVRSYSEMRNCE